MNEIERRIELLEKEKKLLEDVLALQQKIAEAGKSKEAIYIPYPVPCQPYQPYEPYKVWYG